MSTRMKVLVLIVVAAFLGATMSQAFAAGNGPGVGVLSPFDATDGAGVRISQYQLSVNEGGWVRDQDNKALALLVKPIWDFYRWAIGILAYIVDWTVGLGWVNTIAGPLVAATDLIRTKLMEPLGLTDVRGGGLLSLIIAVAVVMAAIRIFRGQSGKGWADVITSALVAAAATTILAAPVTYFMGGEHGMATPLKTAQRYAIATSNVIAGKEIPDAPVNSDAAAQELAEKNTDRRAQNKDGSEAEQIQSGWSKDGPILGGLLVDTFIRPVHQSINYGATIDNDAQCRPVYDEALKAGPYTDDASEIRDKLKKDCADKGSEYYDYSDAPTNSWVVITGVFIYSVACMALMVVVFVALLWLGILSMAWSAFKLGITAVFAILPGQSRVGLIRSIVDIVVNLVYVVVSLSMLSLSTAMIKEWLKSDQMILVKYAATDLMMLAAAILMIVAWWQTRKTGTNWMKKFGGSALNAATAAGNPVAKSVGGVASRALSHKIGRGLGGGAGAKAVAGGGRLAGVARVAKLGGQIAMHASGASGVMMAGKALGKAGTAAKLAHAASGRGQRKMLNVGSAVRNGSMGELFAQARNQRAGTPEESTPRRAVGIDAPEQDHAALEPSTQDPATVGGGAPLASTGSVRLDRAVAAMGRRRGQLDTAVAHVRHGWDYKNNPRAAKPTGSVTGVPLEDYVLRAAGRNARRAAPLAQAAGRGVSHAAAATGRAVSSEATYLRGPSQLTGRPAPSVAPSVRTTSSTAPTKSPAPTAADDLHRTATVVPMGRQPRVRVPKNADALQPSPLMRTGAVTVDLGKAPKVFDRSTPIKIVNTPKGRRL